MIKINKEQFYQIHEVLGRLDRSMRRKESFGLIRFGDGTIKAAHAFHNNDINQLKQISMQEGIPITSFEKIIEFWKTSANICDFIDSPEVYFSPKFWERTKKHKKRISEKTIERLFNWKRLYNQIGIVNKNYCNPEINFLSCVNRGFRRKTLPDLMKNKKICCITSRDDLQNILQQYNVTILQIPGKNENQFSSFSKIIDTINDKALDFDLWLIAAGELGRIYPGLIKFKGGRAFDIGSLVDYWATQEVPSRLIPYMKQTENPLKLELTNEGKEYLKYL